MRGGHSRSHSSVACSLYPAECGLAKAPKAVEAYLGGADSSEFTDPARVVRAREALAELLTGIVVVPARTEEARPCYAVTLRGDLSALFRRLARKRKSASESGSGARSGLNYVESPDEEMDWLVSRYRQFASGPNLPGFRTV